MSNLEMNTLAQLLKAANLDLFNDRHSYPKSRAQDNLSGRTHYVDDSTLRYFASRIVSAHETCSGCLFYIVESVALDYNKTRRGFRGVVFDIWGSAVYRPNFEHCHTSSDKARRAMYEWLDGFDVAAHYITELERKSRRMEAEARSLREAGALIYAQSQPVEA